MTGDKTGMTGDKTGMTEDKTGMTGDKTGMTEDKTGMTGREWIPSCKKKIIKWLFAHFSVILFIESD